MDNEFEKYPKLSRMLEEYATHGRFSNWSVFIEELNNALRKKPKTTEGYLGEFEPIQLTEEKN